MTHDDAIWSYAEEFAEKIPGAVAACLETAERRCGFHFHGSVFHYGCGMAEIPGLSHYL